MAGSRKENLNHFKEGVLRARPGSDCSAAVPAAWRLDLGRGAEGHVSQAPERMRA